MAAGEASFASPLAASMRPIACGSPVSWARSIRSPGSKTRVFSTRLPGSIATKRGSPVSGNTNVWCASVTSMGKVRRPRAVMKAISIGTR